MSTKIKFLISLVLLHASVLRGQEIKEINGKIFVKNQEQWHQQARNGRLWEIVPGQLSFKFKATVGENAKQEFLHGKKILRYNGLGIYDIELLPDENLFDFLLKYETSGLFEFMEVATYGILFGTPNDPNFNQQWNMNIADAPQAWDITQGSSTVPMAIIGIGIDWDHQDLLPNIWQNLGEDADGDNRTLEGGQFDPGDLNGVDNDGNGTIDDLIGWNFSIPPSNDVSSNNNHDTRIAGVLGARSNNSIGIAGLAGGWGNTPGCSIMTIPVDDLAPKFNAGAVDDAIYYAVNKGAKVINCSFGIIDQPDEVINAINSAIEFAESNNVVIFCAAGNYQSDYLTHDIAYPASHSQTIAVGGTTSQDKWWNFSSYDTNPSDGIILDIAAPAQGVYSTQNNNTYGTSGDGTSFAAPHVAATAALMLTINPQLTASQARQILRDTAEKIDPNSTYTDQFGNQISSSYNSNGYSLLYGYGRLNAYQALLLAHAYQNKSVSSTATAANNGRRLVKDSSSKYHLVFESGITSGGNVLSEIFYRNSTDGVNWSTPVRLSAGNEQNRFPSIAERSGKLYVVWQRKTGTNTYDIFFRHYTGSSWETSQTIASGISPATSPLPVVVTSTPSASFEMMVVYRSTGGGLRSRRSTSLNGATWQSELDVTTNPSARNPSLVYRGNDYAYFQVSWDNGSQVYYRKFLSSSWGSESTVSSGSAANTHEYSSFAVGSTNNRHIAWQATDPSQGNRKVILHNLDLNPTVYTKFYSSTVNYLRPNISGFESGGAVVLWHDEASAKNIRSARFNGAYWETGSAGIVYATNGTEVSTATMNPPASPIKAVYRSAGSAPYTLSLGSLLQKSAATETITYSRQLLYASGDSAILAWRLFAPQIIGANTTLDFPAVSNDDSLMAASLDAKLSFDFVVPSNAVEAKLYVEVYAESAAKLLQPSKSVLPIGFELIDPATNRQLTFAAVGNIVLSGEAQTSTALLLPLTAVRGRAVRLRPFLSNVEFEKVRGSLVHEYGVSPATNQQEKPSTAPAAMRPSHLSMRIHPNPFNPSTQIHFSLPAAGLVSLRIFDINGRLVRAWNNEAYNAGEHSRVWDGNNHRGSPMTSGMYFAELAFSKGRSVTKLMLIR